MSRGACGRVFPPMMTMKPEKPIETLILSVRSQKVILDADLAELYDVPTKRLNEQVKRNADRFPEDFMFQLTAQGLDQLEVTNCDFKFGSSSKRRCCAELVAICDQFANIAVRLTGPGRSPSTAP